MLSSITAPDAPSREDRSKAEIINWHVINIPGSDISKGHTLTEYLGAAPSQGSGGFILNLKFLLERAYINVLHF